MTFRLGPPATNHPNAHQAIVSDQPTAHAKACILEQRRRPLVGAIGVPWQQPPRPMPRLAHEILVADGPVLEPAQ
jgi:hypothetical protein